MTATALVDCTQAITFSGIDTKRRKILGNRCGNLDYVPFVEHPWGPEYIPKYNLTTGSVKCIIYPCTVLSL